MVGVLADGYPRARTIHLVMDNLNTHCRKSLTDYYGEKIGARLWKRLTVHHTPEHGSWLNQAEIEIGLFSRQCLGKRRIPELCGLRTEARAWNRRVSRDRVCINWKFDRTFHYNKIRRSWNQHVGILQLGIRAAQDGYYSAQPDRPLGGGGQSDSDRRLDRAGLHGVERLQQ
jgi:hypothetical protein